jgi:hypothetical protein
MQPAKKKRREWTDLANEPLHELFLVCLSVCLADEDMYAVVLAIR